MEIINAPAQAQAPTSASASAAPDLRTAPEFSGADRALVPAALLCGFIFCEWILFPPAPGLSVFLFAVLASSAALLYFRAKGDWKRRESRAACVVLCLSGAPFFLFDTTALWFCSLLFLALVYLYWVAALGGTRLQAGSAGHFPGDMLNQCLLVPFHNFTLLFAGAGQCLQRNAKGRVLFWGIAGVTAAAPLLLLVLGLLLQADDAFSRLWNGIRALLRFDLARYLLECILGVPVACYLYGSLYGNACRRNTEKITAESLQKSLLRLRIAPGALIQAPLAAFNLLYLLFLAALGQYFFSAFFGVLPGNLTYAEYARQGFFELCGVSAINLGLIAFAYAVTRRDANGRPVVLRLMTGLMTLFTILLIAAAMSKMFLYISWYGLTRLRVYTTWFMALLLVVFLLLVLWHVRPFPLAKPLVLCFVVGFLALTYGNTDGLIAKYNLTHYAEGTLESMDYTTLKGLSDAAAPYLYEAYAQTEDPAEKELLRQTLLFSPWAADPATGNLFPHLKTRDPYRDFLSWNLQSHRADQLRASVRYTAGGAETRDPGRSTGGAETSAPGRPIDGAETSAPDRPIGGAETSAPGRPIGGAETSAPDRPIGGAETSAPGRPIGGAET